jgi:hypothetical protein
MTELPGKVASPIEHPDQFFISGEPVAPSSGSMIDVIPPSTEDL